jgi:hypothetical protein
MKLATARATRKFTPMALGNAKISRLFLGVDRLPLLGGWGDVIDEGLGVDHGGSGLARPPGYKKVVAELEDGEREDRGRAPV